MSERLSRWTRAGPGEALLPCVGMMELDVSLPTFAQQLVLLVAAIAAITLVERYQARRARRLSAASPPPRA